MRLNLPATTALIVAATAHESQQLQLLHNFSSAKKHPRIDISDFFHGEKNTVSNRNHTPSWCRQWTTKLTRISTFLYPLAFRWHHSNNASLADLFSPSSSCSSTLISIFWICKDEKNMYYVIALGNTNKKCTIQFFSHRQETLQWNTQNAFLISSWCNDWWNKKLMYYILVSNIELRFGF